MFSADDVLKSMECENNLIMFKAIAHLQVGNISKCRAARNILYGTLGRILYGTD